MTAPTKNFQQQQMQINQQTQRTTQLLTASLQLFSRVPDPPRAVLQSDATLLWVGPKETRNVTHFNIYVGTDTNLDRRVPVDQLKSVNVFGTPAWISSFNEASGKESPRMRALTAGFPGVPWFPEIRIAGVNSTDARLFTDPTTGAITLLGSDVTIVIDPSTGSITITNGDVVTTLDGLVMRIDNDTSGNHVTVAPGQEQIIASPLPSNDLVLELFGYADGHVRGPELVCTQSQGTEAAPTATQSGDPIGGLRARGTYAGPASSNDVARVAAVAEENFTSSAQGASVIIEATDATTNTRVEVARFKGALIQLKKDVAITGALSVSGAFSPTGNVSIAGDLNVTGVYKVAGTQVVGAQQGAITAPSISTTAATGTAGGTYTGTEQAMLNQQKAAINQLNADIASLQTAVNALRSALATHGLTA